MGVDRTQEPYFPSGRYGIAIGDIHGRADLLTLLLERIEGSMPSPADTDVIFLGDYIDRGPASRAVISLLTEGRPHAFQRHFLMGNHEEALLAFLNDPCNKMGWLDHGGRETLASYGVTSPPNCSPENATAIANALYDAMPASHLIFLERLRPFVEFGDYLFVHAGVDVDVALERQTTDDLFWIREPFLSGSTAYEKVVVHGHTVEAQPYRDYRRIGLDTGAYASGRLSAALFHNSEVAFFTASMGGGVQRSFALTGHEADHKAHGKAPGLFA